MRIAEIILTIIFVFFLVYGFMFWFNDAMFPFIILMTGISLNDLLLGQKYHNKTYFLVKGVVVVVSTIMLLYNSTPILYIKLLQWMFLVFMAFVSVREYKYRETNPKRPWKNEW